MARSHNLVSSILNSTICISLPPDLPSLSTLSTPTVVNPRLLSSDHGQSTVYLCTHTYSTPEDSIDPSWQPCDFQHAFPNIRTLFQNDGVYYTLLYSMAVQTIDDVLRLVKITTAPVLNKLPRTADRSHTQRF